MSNEDEVGSKGTSCPQRDQNHQNIPCCQSMRSERMKQGEYADENEWNYASTHVRPFPPPQLHCLQSKNNTRLEWTGCAYPVFSVLILFVSRAWLIALRLARPMAGRDGGKQISTDPENTCQNVQRVSYSTLYYSFFLVTLNACTCGWLGLQLGEADRLA
jgi:hypothetical protein